MLENGFNYANTFFALDLEVSPICLSITTPHDGQNTFVSPYFACTTAIDATASTHNVLINPTFAGNVVNRGPQSIGIEIVGHGNWAHWQFPTAATYTAAPIDDRTVLVVVQRARQRAVGQPAGARRGQVPAGRWALPATTARD